MSLFDFISKPIKSANPLTMLPKPEVSSLPKETPIVKPTIKQPLNFLSKPIVEVIPKQSLISKGINIAKELPSQFKEGSELRTGLQSGILNVSSLVKRFDQVFYDTIGAKKLSQGFKEDADTDKTFSEALARENMPITDERTFSQKLGDPKWFYSSLGQTAPTALASLGVAVPAALAGLPVLGAIGAGVLGGSMAFGSAYQDAIDKGVDDDQAKKIGGYTAIGNAVLESLPALRIVSRIVGAGGTKIIKDSFVKNVTNTLVSAVKQGSIESGTESLQTIYENALKQTYDENQKLFSGVDESAFFGGILGGGIDVSLSGAQAVAERSKEIIKETGGEGGFVKNPFAPKETPGDVPPSKATQTTSKPAEAFNKSTNQEVVGMKDGKTFEIGTYGKNAIERKTAQGKEDRLPKSELPKTLKYISQEYVAGKDPFRKDNIVHVAELPSGEKRAIVTRINAKGNDEVINFFKIGKDYDKFIENLESFGTPGGIRTRDSLFRTQTADSAGQGSFNLSQGAEKSNGDNFEQANQELTQQLEKESAKAGKEVTDILEVKKDKAHIDSLKMENLISREMLLEDPARQLSKYTNKRTGELPEVTGNPKSVFSQRGDDIVTELGFKDSEEARAAYEAYVERRARVLKTSKNLSEITQEYRDKKAILDAVTKKLRAIGVGRKIRVDSIQEFFNLTDAEMAKVIKGKPDYRLISEDKFQQLLKDIEAKAYEVFKLSEARAKVEYTIYDKELIKTDNLLQAMKLPDIKDMTIEQLEKLDELMKTFKQGDEFLGVRQLETIKNTDLANVKTKREVLEDLAKRTGVPYLDLGNIKIGKFDRYLYDVALARQSPFHRIMVEDTSKALANANVRLHQFKNEFNDLMIRARKSRSRSLLNRAIPTDDTIFDWLDSDSGTKVEIAKRMTAEELDAARFVYNKYAEVRDYLVNRGQLDRYRTNYITHVARGFLEAVKESVKPKYVNGRKIPTRNLIKRSTRGVFEGLKEMLAEYKQQEAYFNIMNQKTGEVLPLEKFFRFSLKRTDQLVPTKNVSRAVLQYMSAFEKKAALDSIVPKIDVYAHSITPNGMTPRGLEMDDSIKRFVKEWLNTKRGRVADTVLVTPGGPVDWALRTLIGFTRMIDLGINVPVGLASNVGEQLMTTVNIGFQKTGLGIARSLTPQGKKIAQKYSGFVGERMIDKIRDTSKNVGDKFSEAIFGLFSAASRQANIEHLLGSMTKEEFAKGEISPERLGALRLEIGKYRVMEQGESVIGKTAIGKAFTQYKSWAVGTVHSTLSNLNTMRKMIAQGTNPATSREFQELFRATIMLSFIAAASYGAYSRLRDEKERTFLEQLAFKAMNDSFTMIGALSPSLWTSPARVLSFIENLGKSVTDMAVSLATGERTKQDKNIKGLSAFINTFTPSVVRTVQKMELDELFKDITSNKPNKLNGIKLTPRAGKLDSIKAQSKSKLKGIKLVPKKKTKIELK